MTVNILTLNSSETEFLLIGLSKQLAKIHNSSLNISYSARNLGFMFDEHLTFSDQISSVSRFFAVSIHTLIPKQLPPWLLQLSLSQPAQILDHPVPTDPK